MAAGSTTSASTNSTRRSTLRARRIVLLSPSGTPEGYFAEFGWVAPQGTAAPGPDTVWTAPADAKLTPETPVTLTYDNGAGLVFTRKIALDQAYLFTVTDTVANHTAAPVTLTPYGRVVRLGEPKTAGYYILHEGPIGVFGAAGQNEPNYKDLKDKPRLDMAKAETGWLGFTDKYWAATLVPGKAFTSCVRQGRTAERVLSGRLPARTR